MSSSRDAKPKVMVTLPTFEQMIAKKTADDEKNTKTEVTEMNEEELKKAREELELFEEKTQVLCGSMRKEALVDADRIINEAREQAEAIRNKARAEGYDDAFDTVKSDLEFARDNMINAAREIEETSGEMFDMIQARVFDIAISVTKTILFRELDKDNEAYLAIIENALEPLRDELHITLRMSPDGYDRIFGGDMPEINIEDMKERGIKVVRDPQIARGDCAVDSERGSFGVGIETQTQRMMESVRAKKGERTI